MKIGRWRLFIVCIFSGLLLSAGLKTVLNSLTSGRASNSGGSVLARFATGPLVLPDFARPAASDFVKREPPKDNSTSQPSSEISSSTSDKTASSTVGGSSNNGHAYPTESMQSAPPNPPSTVPPPPSEPAKSSQTATSSQTAISSQDTVSSSPESSDTGSSKPEFEQDTPYDPSFEIYDRLMKDVQIFGNRLGFSIVVDAALSIEEIYYGMATMEIITRHLPTGLLADFGINNIFMTFGDETFMDGSRLILSTNAVQSESVDAIIKYMADQVFMSGITVELGHLNPPDFDIVGMNSMYVFSPNTPELSYFASYESQYSAVHEIKAVFIEMVNGQSRLVRMTDKYPLFHKLMLICPILCERYPSLKQTAMAGEYT